MARGGGPDRATWTKRDSGNTLDLREQTELIIWRYGGARNNYWDGKTRGQEKSSWHGAAG